jgi:mannitol-1-phosphate 5-dehydrogenase
MRRVRFGAGNIGRGLFSQLLHESGYDICFMYVREDVVEALKTKGRYDVVMADEAGEHISVDRVTAFQSKNEADEVTQRLVEADLITTVIGPAVLPVTASAIAEGS